MFFNPNDVSQFLSNKQFIDTAVIPLVSVSFDEETARRNASAAQFLMSLTNFIEQQFKGRLMLTTPFTYFESQHEMISINTITEHMKLAGFQHIFFITCDNFWVKCNNSKDIIWLPSIPLESMDVGVKQRVLEDQLSLIITRFSASWNA